MAWAIRQLKKALLTLLALIFLFEAWLWDVTGRLVARIILVVPFEQFRRYVTRNIEPLSPWLTLLVFTIPAIILFPLKLIAVWLLAKGYVLSGFGTVAFAKVAGFGVTSFLFSLCKPKLLQLKLVKWVYETLVYWRKRAHDFVAPTMAKIRAEMKALRERLFPPGSLLSKLRARMHKRQRGQA